MDSWKDKENWPKLLKGEDCPMCEDIHMVENKHSYLIKELTNSYVRFPKNQADYGWVMVINKKHVAELFELNLEELHGFIDEVSMVAKAVSEEFQAVKIYYSIFGALCPHLHVHILPKTEKDDPHAPIDLNSKVKLLSEDEYQKILTSLRSRLNRKTNY